MEVIELLFIGDVVVIGNAERAGVVQMKATVLDVLRKKKVAMKCVEKIGNVILKYVNLTILDSLECLSSTNTKYVGVEVLINQ